MGLGLASIGERVTLEDFGIVPNRRRDLWVDPMAFFERLVGYYPYPQQRAFHEDRHRIKILAGGKRIGKSLMASREIEPILMTPETHVWIVGATYRRAVKEFEYIWDDLIRSLHFGTREKNFNVRGGYMNIRFAWNAVVEVRSAKDPNELEAEPLDGVILAEPAQLPEYVFELSRERVAERRGVMILNGTPPLARHWLKARYDRGFDPDWPDYASFHIPATEAPYPGLDEVAKLKRELSDLRFRRDVLAEFVATEEIVYADFEYPVHVDDVEYDKNLPLYRAFDPGYKSPCVCLWVQVDEGKGRVYVIDEYYEQFRSESENIEAILEQHDEAGYDKPTDNTCDPHMASFRHELDARGVELDSMAGSQKGDVERGIELVRQALKLLPDGGPGLIVDRGCNHTIDEFTLYHYADTTGEKIAKEDDHCMDALRYLMLHLFDEDEPEISWA